MRATAITCLFLDIGGVLLTNGWDYHARFVRIAESSMTPADPRILTIN